MMFQQPFLIFILTNQIATSFLLMHDLSSGTFVLLLCISNLIFQRIFAFLDHSSSHEIGDQKCKHFEWGSRLLFFHIGRFRICDLLSDLFDQLVKRRFNQIGNLADHLDRILCVVSFQISDHVVQEIESRRLFDLFWVIEQCFVDFVQSGGNIIRD